MSRLVFPKNGTYFPSPANPNAGGASDPQEKPSATLGHQLPPNFTDNGTDIIYTKPERSPFLPFRPPPTRPLDELPNERLLAVLDSCEAVLAQDGETMDRGKKRYLHSRVLQIKRILSTRGVEDVTHRLEETHIAPGSEVEMDKVNAQMRQTSLHSPPARAKMDTKTAHAISLDRHNSPKSKIRSMSIQESLQLQERHALMQKQLAEERQQMKLDNIAKTHAAAVPASEQEEATEYLKQAYERRPDLMSFLLHKDSDSEDSDIEVHDTDDATLSIQHQEDEEYAQLNPYRAAYMSGYDLAKEEEQQQSQPGRFMPQ